MTEAGLELALAPEAVARVLRRVGVRPGRGRKLRIGWHDGAGGELAALGLVLEERGGVWRLGQVPHNRRGPGMPAALVAEASAPDGLGHPGVPKDVASVAAFEGSERAATLRDGAGEASLRLLEGVLRPAGGEARPVCRLILSGPAAVLVPLLDRVAGVGGVMVSRGGLAMEALALPDGAMGPASVVPGMSVGDGLAALAGQLSAAVLGWAERVTSAPPPEPVHQMRVATRRLRSALLVFRRAADGPSLQALRAALKDLGSRLGAARDWDVFLAETAGPVASAFPGDRRLARMVGAAERRREEAYAALAEYLDGAEFRRLALRLAGFAALRPWEADADPDQTALLGEDVAAYAANRLNRRLAAMLEVGAELRELPAERLHQLRKDGKKLRYAGEFFAPLFPGKALRRFQKRLSRLQEVLGHLNDGATAAAMLERLGGGEGRAFAAGAVLGYVAARSDGARRRSRRAWRKLRRADPYWP